MSRIDIHELEWIPVPSYNYLLKYSFSDSGYYILLSNLTLIYGEKRRVPIVEARFTKLNPHVKMKPHVILENVKKSLKESLTDDADFNFKFEENGVNIILNFYAGHVLCKYVIEMSLLPAGKVLDYVLAPTILGALLSQRKVLALQKTITSGEGIKSSPSKAVSSQDVLEPSWLKGQNVPYRFVFDSFLTLQSHFKELTAENNEADRIAQSEYQKAAMSSFLPKKKIKQMQNTKFESSVNFEEDDGCKPIKEEETNIDADCSKEEETNIDADCSKEEETNIDASMQEPPKNIAKKKKVFKF